MRYELRHRNDRPSDWFETETEGKAQGMALYEGMVFGPALKSPDGTGRQTILGWRNAEVEDGDVDKDVCCEIRRHSLGRSGVVDD